MDIGLTDSRFVVESVNSLNPVPLKGKKRKKKYSNQKFKKQRLGVKYYLAQQNNTFPPSHHKTFVYFRVETPSKFNGAVHTRDYRKSACTSYGLGSTETELNINMLTEKNSDGFCGIYINEVR